MYVGLWCLYFVFQATFCQYFFSLLDRQMIWENIKALTAMTTSFHSVIFSSLILIMNTNFAKRAHTSACRTIIYNDAQKLYHKYLILIYCLKKRNMNQKHFNGFHRRMMNPKRAGTISFYSSTTCYSGWKKIETDFFFWYKKRVYSVLL